MSDNATARRQYGAHPKTAVALSDDVTEERAAFRSDADRRSAIETHRRRIARELKRRRRAAEDDDRWEGRPPLREAPFDVA